MGEQNSQGTILLVEDNQDDVDLTLRAFKKSRLSNRFVVKRDGQEALDYLLGTDDAGKSTLLPVVVLLDLNMPKKDGREALKEIKTDPGLKKIPIVVLTTSNADEDIAITYELGVNSYITKPVTFKELVNIMKKLSEYWFDTVKLPE